MPAEEIQWVKASKSVANGECIEVAKFMDGTVGIRDSKHPEQPFLRISRDKFEAFLTWMKDDGPGNLDA